MRIVVVGGGPAGIMAAIRAGQLKQDVILVEKNPTLGKKLLLSGKGRCNVTNLCDLDSFLKRFSKTGQFLRDAFKNFFNQELINFFEKRGLKLKVERQLRVFPVTDKSDSILKVLKKELQDNKVKIIYNASMRDILIQDNKLKGILLSEGKFIPADKVILAAGGASYSFTGSTGEGIEIAKRLGHTIASLSPGLVPLETRQRYPRDLEGLTLKNIRLKFIQPLRAGAGFSDGQREIVSGIGELLFTKFGISGPLVLTLSGQIVDWLNPVRDRLPKAAVSRHRRLISNGVNENKDVFVEIDLKPALSKEQLNARLIREFELSPKKTIKNLLKNLLPQRLVVCFIGILKANPDKLANQITAFQRQGLVSLLKGFRLDIIKPRTQEAMITRGGISLKDINPRTMESRRIKGLYFAGEMIDVDADTGGFNLQAAFSTGCLAGESAALA